MRLLLVMLVALGALFVMDVRAEQTGAAPAAPAKPAAKLPESIYQVPIEPMKLAAPKSPAAATSLAGFKGKVMLILNVASKCGNTPQYQGLEEMYQKYKAKGLELVAFPSNDFGSQEPGSEQEILDFCTNNYKVTFPMFAKIHAVGPPPAPIYQYLLANVPADSAVKSTKVQWNFEKWLISRDGKVVGRFSNKMKPNDPALVAAVEAELAKPAPAPAK